MSEPSYVPVLQARPHAVAAYAWLPPSGQRHIAPLWNLPPRPGVVAPALATVLRKDLGAVSEAQRHGTAWVDAPFADEAQVAVLAELLEEYCVYGRLQPVTGPDRSPLQQSAALVAAIRGGRGIGVRVRVTGEWDAQAAEGVRSLLAGVEAEAQVDLLLDMGAVRADRPDAGKEALRALDALFPLAPWRDVCVLSGGFPRVTAEMLEQGLRKEPRGDWALWHEIVQSRRAYVPALRYGDYGTQHADAIAEVPRPPDRKGGGPDWGFLRYTTERAFVLAKVVHKGRERREKIAFNRAAAREIVELPDFRGPTASAGDTWLRDLARGSGNTGAFEKWLTVGNAQHLAYVAHTLRRL
ncbi:beta family protein [Streptomyces sp. NPDC093105]|uniref:beta family protein n=1 Tax=Streptomyces sp. NPDC093105 TaxID=3366029 RepID=UPI00382F3087